MKKYFLMMSLFFAALLMVSCGDKKSSSDDEDEKDDEEQAEERGSSKRNSRDADYESARSERRSSSSRSMSPQEVVEKFLNGMMNRDVDAVLSCVDQEKMRRKGRVPSDEEMMKELDRNGGVSDYTITKSFEDEPGVWAVKAKVQFNDGYSTTMGYKLKKINGRWLIVN